MTRIVVIAIVTVLLTPLGLGRAEISRPCGHARVWLWDVPDDPHDKQITYWCTDGRIVRQ